MTVETATFLSALNTSYPAGSDRKKEGDNHIRLVKAVLKNTFPNASTAFYFPTQEAIATTENVAASDFNRLFVADTSGGAFTVNLPAVAALWEGWFCHVVLAVAGNDLTIDADGVETINGAETLVVSAANVMFTLRTDGTEWFTDAIVSQIGVTVQAYDAATAFLDTVQVWSANQNFADKQLIRAMLLDYSEVTNAIGDFGGGAQDIDLESGNVIAATVSTAEVTFTFSNPVASDDGCSFTLFLTNGGSQTVNWPVSVVWAGGTAPTLTTAGVDVLAFATIDGGTTWYGFTAGLDFS